MDAEGGGSKTRAECMIPEARERLRCSVCPRDGRLKFVDFSS